MIRTALRLVALALAVAAGAAHAQAARYEIDPEHFSVGFLVDHLGYARVLGMFQKALGSYAFDEKTGAISDVRIEIEADSVYTSHRRRDNHLKSADFLNAGEFPKIVFTGAQAKRTGERTFAIDGQLELIGKKLPVTIEAKWNKSAQYELPGATAYVMGVSARTSFKRSDFGMKYGIANGWIGDTVEMMFEFEARRR
jgi:polyisoprenoid-binding protein YceI